MIWSWRYKILCFVVLGPCQETHKFAYTSQHTCKIFPNFVANNPLTNSAQIIWVLSRKIVFKIIWSQDGWDVCVIEIGTRILLLGYFLPFILKKVFFTFDYQVSQPHYNLNKSCATTFPGELLRLWWGWGVWFDRWICDKHGRNVKKQQQWKGIVLLFFCCFFR